MILSKTPFRVSFIGGGTDFQEFYDEFGGQVISASINRYIYLGINRKFDNLYRVSYSETENVDLISKIKHPIVKAILSNYFKTIPPIEIVSLADIPAQGSGLGSSSAFSVGLLNLLYYFTNKIKPIYDIANIACDVEINKCKSPIGKQDQFGCAFGGLKKIIFNRNDTIVKKIQKKYSANLENSLLFFYTGKVRKAESVLSSYKKNIKNSKKTEYLKKILNLTDSFEKSLKLDDIKSCGKIVGESWIYKKELANNVSTPFIDEIYSSAIEAGAYGGKILGAGNGGFMMFIAPKSKHKLITSKLNKLRKENFKFEYSGSKIIDSIR